MSADIPPLGAIVDIPVGRGVVRFAGTTAFQPGPTWIGIELYEANGKNNGTIQGVTYFNCKPKFGVFVRLSQVKEILGHERDLAPARPTPTHRRTPSSSVAIPPAPGHKRTSSSGLLVRSNSSRTAASTPSPRAASPAKPPVTKVVLTKPAAPGSAAPSKRNSLGPPARQPISNGQSREKVSSPVSRSDSPHKLSSSPNTSSPLASSPPPAFGTPSASRAHALNTRSPLAPAAEISSPPRHSLPDPSELQELRAKIRVLEAKRTDDSQHIRELETRLSEAESFVAIRPKLQAKLASLHTDLTSSRRDLSDAEQLKTLAESRVIDAQEQLEMAMLDKEVAEERAELAESELEDVKERLAIMEVEVEVMKEDGEEPEGDSEAGRGSLAYIQLEKHNERLKDALIR